MKTKYLAYSQAASISADYQHVVGHCFGDADEKNRVVDVVTVAPYSRILQWSFVRQLLRGTSLGEALALTQDRRFDVIVISVARENRGDFRVKDLRRFLSEQRLPFDAARYRCQYAGPSVS